MGSSPVRATKIKNDRNNASTYDFILNLLIRESNFLITQKKYKNETLRRNEEV